MPPPAPITNTKDIWVYAAEKVANKGVLARIGHSARFHSLRSAVNSKGSFGSKLLGVIGAAGRASFNLIPLPIIGALVASAETAIEKKFRSWAHGRSGRDKDTHTDYVKFALKELSVENMDRYRWKVEESAKAMKVSGDAFAAKVNAVPVNSQMAAPCASQVELAFAIAQAERRLKIFEDEVTKMKILMEASIAWAALTKTSVVDYKNQIRAQFLAAATTEQGIINIAVTQEDKAAATASMMAVHAECGDFCVYKDNKLNGNWDKFRAGAAAVVRTLQEPFSPETFLAANRTSFESANQLENFQPKKPG